MTKVTCIVDFLSFLMDSEKNGVGIKSLENVLSLLHSGDSEYKEKIFAVPIWNNENVAVLIPNIFPSLLEDLADVEYTISIMTISHFNFSFMVFREMYILTDE